MAHTAEFCGFLPVAKAFGDAVGKAARHVVEVQQLLVEVTVSEIEVTDAGHLVGAVALQHVHLGDVAMPAAHAGEIAHDLPYIAHRCLDGARGPKSHKRLSFRYP